MNDSSTEFGPLAFGALMPSFATGRYPWEAPPWFWVYAWVGFFVTFNWEVSRKIRAKARKIAAHLLEAALADLRASASVMHGSPL